ncbi:MAG: Carbohydrate-selective porin, partial [bacterium]|nr:Carbohydrate-selective porin [bacterium]
MIRARLVCLGFAASLVFTSARAGAQAGPPAAHEDIAFDFMNLLSQHGLHDLENERWNAYGQFTYITSFKLPFSAPYTNANGSVNSLS